jgi:hypothetical protein
MVPQICRKIEAVGGADPIYARLVMLLGSVVNRLAFEALLIAKDADAVI